MKHFALLIAFIVITMSAYPVDTKDKPKVIKKVIYITCDKYTNNYCQGW